VAWQPDPSWTRVSAGASGTTYGVWRGQWDGVESAIKRLLAPTPEDERDLGDERSAAWWARETLVARSGAVTGTVGLRADAALSVEDDGQGSTVVVPWVQDAANPGLFVARALGRFARNDIPDVPWLARGQLRSRLQRVERRGGWPTLQRTTLADIADHLWRRRGELLDRLDALPQVLQHGDPTAANLLGRRGEDVVAIDWHSLGTGPVGHDLGLWALSAREDHEPLLVAYVEGLAGHASAAEAELGARVSAVFTVLTRLEWALARVSEGEGALAGKYAHPSVAPYVRAMQRQAPQIEALLT